MTRWKDIYIKYVYKLIFLKRQLCIQPVSVCKKNKIKYFCSINVLKMFIDTMIWVQINDQMVETRSPDFQQDSSHIHCGYCCWWALWRWTSVHSWVFAEKISLAWCQACTLALMVLPCQLTKRQFFLALDTALIASSIQAYWLGNDLTVSVITKSSTLLSVCVLRTVLWDICPQVDSFSDGLTFFISWELTGRQSREIWSDRPKWGLVM